MLAAVTTGTVTIHAVNLDVTQFPLYDTRRQQAETEVQNKITIAYSLIHTDFITKIRAL